MSKRFYTSVQCIGGKLYIDGYDEEGKRIRESGVEKYDQLLFVRTQEKDNLGWTDFYGNAVSQVFKKQTNIKETQNQIKEAEKQGHRFYGNIQLEYQYIAQHFPLTEEGGIYFNPDYIRSINIDIEVDSSAGFPDPENATSPITSIALSYRGKMCVIGTRPYANPKGFTYYHEDSEVAMLDRFLRIFEGIDPDIITGWYVEFFDMPYLINRMGHLFAWEEGVGRLSPHGIVRKRNINRFKKKLETYSIAGRAILDMLELYKKFTYTEQESYKLDFIAYEELKEKKLDWSKDYSSLQNMYEEDFERYVDYNLQDVVLVDKINDKLKLVDIAVAMAYETGSNYQDIFSPVRLCDACTYNILRQQKVAVSPMQFSEDKSYPGGAVREPQVGKHEWVMSFDLASLYPHLIMTLNIGHETHRADLGKEDLNLQSIIKNGMPDRIRKICKRENVSISAEGHYYSNDKEGLFSSLMNDLYVSRKEIKERMLEEMRKDGDKNLIAALKGQQEAKKIFMNSVSGAMGNAYSRWRDLRHVSSITVTGQLVIQWIIHHVNKYLNEYLGTLRQDYIVASDTDSIYVNMKGVVDKFRPRLEKIIDFDEIDRIREKIKDNQDEIDYLMSGVEKAKIRKQQEKAEDLNNKAFCLTSENNDLQAKFDELDKDRIKKIVKFLDWFSDNYLQKAIDECCKEFCEDVLNAFSNKIFMKREIISDLALWTSKKRYCARIWNSEGVAYEKGKWKITGLDIIKAVIPARCQQKMKELLPIMLANSDKREAGKNVRHFVNRFKKEFMDMGIEEISFPRGVNGLDKYYGETKKVPIHVRGSLLYNKLILDKDLENRYELIKNGEKIKFCYLKEPNEVKSHVIAFPGTLPRELGLHEYIDKDIQFDKAFRSPVQALADACEMNISDQRSILDFF